MARVLERKLSVAILNSQFRSSSPFRSVLVKLN